MTTTERASALVKPMPRDRSDRDILREEWRVKAKAAADAEADYAELKKGKSVLFDEMVLRLSEGPDGLPASKAERVARTSDQFKAYLRRMHDAHRTAQDLRIEAEVADREYWAAVANEADQRADKRMHRA